MVRHSIDREAELAGAAAADSPDRAPVCHEHGIVFSERDALPRDLRRQRQPVHRVFRRRFLLLLLWRLQSDLIPEVADTAHGTFYVNVHTNTGSRRRI